MPRLSPILFALAAAGLAGCAAVAGPDPLLKVAQADEGVVIDVRPIVRARPILVENPPASAAPATFAATPPAERAAAAQASGLAPATPSAASRPAPARRLAPPARRAAPASPPPPAASGGPAAATVATAEQPVDVGVNVVADAGQAAAANLGLAYTVRRSSDGAQFLIAQPPGTAFTQGARVRILYGARLRLAPLS